jgi:HD-like signal output (HDOD) protein
VLAHPSPATPVVPIRHRAESLVGGSLDLLTLPDIFLRVKYIVEDPHTTARDLARVISADPATTARILKLVNSALRGDSGHIESVSCAVSLLDMFQVHDLVLATAVATSFFIDENTTATSEVAVLVNEGKRYAHHTVTWFRKEEGDA